MAQDNDVQKFKRYCGQLEKYGQIESIHSPAMALLRRKARKQLLELVKQGSDCTSYINRLWIVGYYYPFQFYVRENENIMETTTFLTMFCGELQEMLTVSDEKHSSLWNLYIGDLHRYMPDDQIQNVLSVGYYTRAIELDSRQGRAFHMISVMRKDLPIMEKLRLMLLGVLAEIPYKKSLELLDFLEKSAANEELDSSEKLIIEFINWTLKDSKSVEHQMIGLRMVNDFKTEIMEDKAKDLPLMITVCRLHGSFLFKSYSYNQFSNWFDVISNVFGPIYSKMDEKKSLLSESILLISDVGGIFGNVDPETKETRYHSAPAIRKDKWNELNDTIMERINVEFQSNPFEIKSSPRDETNLLINGPTSEPTNELMGSLVKRLISINLPTVKLNQESPEPLLCRIDESSEKRAPIRLEGLIEEKLNQSEGGEDWRPVYVMMDFDTIVDKTRIAHKIWDIDDFICILPSTVLDQLDHQKTRLKSVRPIIRALMELQAEGRITLKKCEDDRNCAELLVESARGSSSRDHKNIVAFLCKNPEKQDPMEGVTFYEIQQFYKKYLE